MPNNHSDIEKRLWDAADELCANSTLKSLEYPIPVNTHIRHAPTETGG
jgi:type I restriction enzyme M protein